MHEFHRGSLALDFVGTVGRRASRPQERIPDPAAFGGWLIAAGLTSAPPSRSDHDAALELREALARMAAALMESRRPDGADVDVLNRALAWNRLSAQHFDAESLSVVWDTHEPVRFALARVAADGASTFANDRERLVRCEDPSCGAFLLSRSRGDRRRWCTAEGCGNRARVAAYRRRKGDAGG